MPYYIYRVTPLGPIHQLAKISQFDVFKEASNEAKRLRRETELGAGEKIKTIFAENELQAEELLNEPRGEEPMTGEDY
jgi:vacuolar-type H+-ATPase subunit H